MAQVIAFTVTGIPKAQPRPRAFAKQLGNGKAIARVFEAGTAEAWKGEVALAAKSLVPQIPLAGPIRVDIDFLFARPQKLLTRKYPDGEMRMSGKPDRDNLDKAVLDVLTVLGFWHDDGQVCAGEPRKLYVARNGRPGARIRIESLDEDPCPGSELFATAGGEL